MWLPADCGTVSPITLRQHRAIRQEVSDRIFAPIQGLENEGILYVFLVFQTEEVGQKDDGDLQTQLCGAALREILFSSAATWNMPGTRKREPASALRTHICVLPSHTTWTSGSKSLLWAGYRGGTPDFTRGGYLFFTLCTVNPERIANLQNGKMGRKNRGNPKNGLGIPRIFAFWKTVLRFRFGTASAFTDGLQPFPNPIGAGTQEERCWKDSRSGDMPRRSCRIHG